MKSKIFLSLIFIIVFVCIILLSNKIFLNGNDPGPSLFFYYADLVFNHHVPYKDFLFEYPPAALFFILIPRIFSANYEIYRIIFLFILGLFGLTGLWITLDFVKNNPRKTLFGVLYIITFISLGAITAFRYDLIPAILVLIVIWLKRNNHEKSAYFILAIAVATKIYPIFLLPFLLIEDRNNWKKVGVNLAFFCLGIFLSVLPFITHLSDLKTFITYQTVRGVQIESLWSNILIIKHLIINSSLNVISEAGAIGVVPYPKNIAWISQGIFITFYIALLYLFSKRKNLYLYSFLAILLFITTNRVFSPQYMVWLMVLLPSIFIAVKSVRVLRLSISFFILSLFLTQLIYPLMYMAGGLLEFKVEAVWLLSIRNFCLVLLLIILIFSEIKMFRDKSYS